MLLARSHRGAWSCFAGLLLLGGGHADALARVALQEPTPAKPETAPAPAQDTAGTPASSPSPQPPAAPAVTGEATAVPKEQAGTADAGPSTGSITGDAVYVRSGPSPDYYPVTKLNSGAGVTVLGVEGEWLAIAPPTGCFSTIPQQYVDSADGVHGVVNADRVNVRAGSHLTADRYQVQTQLSKGAEVSIIARSDDGQYRIVPPAGVKLYVHRQYVGRGGTPGSVAASDAKVKDAASPTGIRSSALSGDKTLAVPSRATTTASQVAPPEVQTEERRRLGALDEAMNAEMAKPLATRNFARLTEGYRELSTTGSDDFTKQYAAARLAQAEYVQRLAQSASSLRDVAREIEKEREVYLASQGKVAAPPIAVRAGYDIEGELRQSAVYASALGPRRYRLVNPRVQPPRTVGYVELDESLTLDMDRLMGRYVGIKASHVRPAEGMVNPVPLYVATRIVVLNPEDRSETRAEDVAPSAQASTGGS